MNVVKDWEALITDLRHQLQNGEETCRPLLEKAEHELKQWHEKRAANGSESR